MIIGIVVRNNTREDNNATITEGAYVHGLHNHPAAQQGGSLGL